MSLREMEALNPFTDSHFFADFRQHVGLGQGMKAGLFFAAVLGAVNGT